MKDNKTEQFNWGWIISLGLIVIVAVFTINKEEIFKYLEKSSYTQIKKKEKKTRIYSLTQDEFRLGVLESPYTDYNYIIPTNNKLDYFYIPTSVKNTTIVRKDTVPSLNQVVITKNRVKKYPLGIENVDEIDKEYKFILTIPGDAYIEFFKNQSDLERLIVRSNFEISKK